MEQIAAMEKSLLEKKQQNEQLGQQMGQLKGQNVELKNELKNVRTGENSNGEEN
jgi:hypothetical protein